MFVTPQTGTRRRFLGTMGTGFGALALQALAGLEARAAGAGATPDPLDPFAPRPAPRPPKAKSVIFLFLVGGPSQIDTFDHKPLLQKLHGQPVPESFRKAVASTRFANVFHGCKDELMASPFSWSQHGQSGLWVSNLMPEVDGMPTTYACCIRCRPIPTTTRRPATNSTRETSGRARRASGRGSRMGSARRTATCRDT